MSEPSATYRGWAVVPYRQPDGCFYAYRHDYDGTVPWHTANGKTVRELRAEIDEIIRERGE